MDLGRVGVAAGHLGQLRMSFLVATCAEGGDRMIQVGFGSRRARQAGLREEQQRAQRRSPYRGSRYSSTAAVIAAGTRHRDCDATKPDGIDCGLQLFLFLPLALP